MHALPKAKVLMKQTMPGQGAAMNRARPNENIRTKEEPQEPPAKKAKTKIVFIEQKKKPLDIRYDASSVPVNYQLVAYGNKEVIEFLLERSRKNGLPVWIANSHLQAQHRPDLVSDPTSLSYHVGRVGYFFHKGLVAKARKLYNVTLQKGKLANLRQGQKRKVTRVDHEKGLSELYPHMPDRDRQTVLRALTTKATKIGKATGTMNVYKQIELAVIAHVRHSHTDYEKLIYMSGKVAARAAVETHIAAKLAEWKGEDGQHVDQDETELVEYEEDTTSESEESVVVVDDEDEEDYSPPPAGQFTERSIAPIDPARPCSRHPEVEWPNPPGHRTPLPHFGKAALDDYDFDYRHPRPQHYSPQGWNSRDPPPPSHTSWHIPPPTYGDLPHPRVQLRPLPPSPPYQQGHPPPSIAAAGYPPWSRAAEPVRFGFDGPPPPHITDYNYEAPRHVYERSPPLPIYVLPPASSAPTAYVPRSPIQYRVLLPAAPPQDPWYASHPSIRYRPLSPEDVLPSREQYSPLPSDRKRARPDDWNSYAGPSCHY